LENVSANYLREIFGEIDDGDAAKLLMAAITYKEIDDLTQKGTAEMYEFRAFEAWSGFDDSNSSKRGRSKKSSTVKNEIKNPELTEQQHEQFVEALNHPPEESGIDAPRSLLHWRALVFS